MPKQYEAMRDKFMAEGMSMKAAKGKAARIYNAKHKANPVTRSYDAKHKMMPMKAKKQPKRR